MDFTVHSKSLKTLSSNCLVIGLFHDGKKFDSNELDGLNAELAKKVSRLISQGDLGSAAGESLLLHDASSKVARVLLLSLGKKKDFSVKTLAKLSAAILEKIKSHQIQSLDWHLSAMLSQGLDVPQAVSYAVQQLLALQYQYTQTKSDKPKRKKTVKMALICERSQATAAKNAVSLGQAIAEGVNYARDLGNLPGNICTPTYLASQAKDLGKTKQIKTTVLDEAEMKRLKMGSFLAVSRGSKQPAKLIIMEYKGADKSQAPIVLVGKGLTFDAGGISIKPAAAMDEMKYDMCGGATVFGVMKAVAKLGLNINLVGVVPSSENLPDGDANKPGDILTSMNGTTIEVLNTDAEGRLILCDALTYVERYKPKLVVDIATLTGACVVALGHHRSGLFSDDDELATDLLAAGEEALDPAWRMPLGEEYSAQLKSNFADLANIGGMPGGSVTAACFLQHFTKKFPWAHLDIAGTAWKSGANKGATGRPVPMLVEFLLRHAN